MRDQTPGTTDSPPGKCVLLVAAGAALRSLICEGIRQRGPHQVISCSTPAQALAAASRLSFDLFILDDRFPEMSGLALHEQLLTFAHLTDVPTILLHVYHPASREVYRRHLILLDEPFHLPQLLTIIETVLAWLSL